jgi:hypothetical protein
MGKNDLVQKLKEKIELKERTLRIYDQIVGQCSLLEELIKNCEEVKIEKEEVK